MERKIRKAADLAPGERKIIPLVEEKLKVGKSSRVVGITRIKKTVEERVEIVDQPLQEDAVQVTRVPIDRVVDKPIPVRQERDVTIVPVLEEVLVIEKKLVLREELHIKKTAKTVNKRAEVSLRKERAVVEHISNPELVRKTG